MDQPTTTRRRPLATHCKRGHEWTPENSRKQGEDRVCRACEAARVKAHRRNPAVRAQLTRYVREWRRNNTERYRAYVVKKTAERHEFIASIRSVLGCARCGETDEDCLDFHHRNPKEKDHMLASTLHNPGWSIRRIKNEIAKCDVLCANCHRKLHAAERRNKER